MNKNVTLSMETFYNVLIAYFGDEHESPEPEIDNARRREAQNYTRYRASLDIEQVAAVEEYSFVHGWSVLSLKNGIRWVIPVTYEQLCAQIDAARKSVNKHNLLN